MVTTLAKPHFYWRQLATSQPESGATPLLLTVSEACIVLRVSRWSLYQLIRSGRLRTITIGSRRLVPMSAVQALIDQADGEAV